MFFQLDDEFDEEVTEKKTYSLWSSEAGRNSGKSDRVITHYYYAE